MRKSSKPVKEFAHLEDEFFDIDKNKKIAHVKLHFAAPSEIFDLSYDTKTPIMSDDFFSWITYCFDMIPSTYKIDLSVTFDDMQGWDAKTLDDIFRKNVLAEYKTSIQTQIKQNRLAFALIGIGALLFVAMMLMNHFWTSASFWKDIVSYVADIATTVVFWEAMTILFVHSKENRSARSALAERFATITFSDTENNKIAK